MLPIFVLVEFCFYWFHRCSHRMRWWWAAHVPHHSGETMNFTTAMRQSVLNAFVGTFIFYLPPVLLGVLRDVLAPGPWRQRLKHLWMPPDWERPGHTPIRTWTVERRDHEQTPWPRPEHRAPPITEPTTVSD